MRRALIILSFFYFGACTNRHKDSNEFETEVRKRYQQKSDTLIVVHSECTECLDFYISQGSLAIPPDLVTDKKLSSTRDIKICGNFPMNLIDASAFSFEPGVRFEIIGKVIKIDTTNAIGSIPLFYVQSWEKL